MSTTRKAPARSRPLDEWLSWLETIHPTAIDMGLTRVSAVADRLGLRPAKRPLILVGGTNGKGSTVAMLSAIYKDAGYTVGAYMSPHIMHFCERIRINGEMVDEKSVVDALFFVELGRAPDSLTYFEYTTLAAMRVFDALDCDVLLFEVGLGGRLDATNIWDADCSIITSIALDHEGYLGSDISVIATEKAAIGRAGKPFIVGESDVPASLVKYASEHDFKLVDVGNLPESSLPQTAMSGVCQKRNAGCAVAAVNALQHLLPVNRDIVSNALMNTRLEGRFERIVINGVSVIFDVAHNPAGAAALADAWHHELGSRRCEIVFATLGDKDIAGVVAALSPIVSSWHCLTLDTPRATSAQELARLVRENTDAQTVTEYSQAEPAIQAALDNASPGGSYSQELEDAGNGCVLVAGSFHTIATIKHCLKTDGLPT